MDQKEAENDSKSWVRSTLTSTKEGWGILLDTTQKQIGRRIYLNVSDAIITVLWNNFF